MLHAVDLGLELGIYEKDIPIGGHRRLAAFVDIFNLLNGNAEQNTNWSFGSSFLGPLSVVPPRRGRVGAKLAW